MFLIQHGRVRIKGVRWNPRTTHVRVITTTPKPINLLVAYAGRQQRTWSRFHEALYALLGCTF